MLPVVCAPHCVISVIVSGVTPDGVLKGEYCVGSVKSIHSER